MSDARSNFKVEDLDTPALLAPEGPIESTAPTFTWAPVPYASSYEFELVDSAGTTLFRRDGIRGHAYRVPSDGRLAFENAYAWRVRAFDHPTHRASPWARMAAFSCTHLPVVVASISPTRILAGEAALLSWSSANARWVWIEPGIGPVSLSGVLPVTAAEDVTYTITATNQWTSCTAEVPLSVNFAPYASAVAHPEDGVAPLHAIFDASGSTDSDGRISEYAWDLDGDGGADATGVSAECTYATPGTVTARVTVTDDEGATDIAEVQVTVRHPAPTLSLSADTTRVLAGDTVLLRWTSENADSVIITAGIGPVPVTGTLALNPFVGTTYTVVAAGPWGTVSREVFVRVLPVAALPAGTFAHAQSRYVADDATVTAFDMQRFAVMTGRVTDQQGSPLVGVTVTLPDRSGYGSAMTDSDGVWHLAVDGGDTLRVCFDRDGYFPVERAIEVPWNDVVDADDVMLTRPDATATRIVFDGNPSTRMSHTGSVVADKRGVRAATLVFAGDTVATAVGSDHATLTLGSLTVRATEYTTSAALPAALPAGSAFTYCVELTADEAGRVTFSQPVAVWVDDIIGRGSGVTLPLFSFDREAGAWVPEGAAMTVSILDRDDDGIAEGADVDGDGLADDIDGDGLAGNETDGLPAQRFKDGQVVWYARVTHFTPYDYAFAAMTGGAGFPDQPYDRTECLWCHRVGGESPSEVDFGVEPVDRATACVKCHWRSVDHPHRNGDWAIDCGLRCHGFFRSDGSRIGSWTQRIVLNPSAFASVATTYGSFNSTASAQTAAGQLHIIHSSAGWPGEVARMNSWDKGCRSCHAPAACSACHDGAASIHTEHAWNAQLGAYAPGYEPREELYGEGTDLGEDLQLNITTSLPCSNLVCHDVRTSPDVPAYVQDTSSTAYYTDGWTLGGTYPWGSNHSSIAAGSRVDFAFEGSKVELYGWTSPTGGLADVYLDGTHQTTIDLRTVTTQRNVLVYASGALGSDPHTLTVEVLGRNSGTGAPNEAVYSRIYVDGFRVYPNYVPPSADCTVCHALDHLAPHGGSSLGAACVDCHVSNVSTEHVDRSSIACRECHRSTDTAVVAAIAGGVTECEGCHAIDHRSGESSHGLTWSEGYWDYSNAEHDGENWIVPPVWVPPALIRRTTCTDCHRVELGLSASDQSALCGRCHAERSYVASTADEVVVAGGGFAYSRSLEDLNSLRFQVLGTDPLTGGLAGVRDYRVPRTGDVGGLCVGDVDNDGPEDVAAAVTLFGGATLSNSMPGERTAALAVFARDSSGRGMQAPKIYPLADAAVGDCAADVAVGDIVPDADDSQETLVLANQRDVGPALHLMRLGSSGVQADDVLPVSGLGRLALADLDGDAYDEVVMTDYGAGLVRVFDQSGASLVESYSVATGGSGPYNLAIGDIMDGPELEALVNNFRNGTVAVLQQGTDGRLHSLGTLGSGTRFYDVALADVEGDARQEAVILRDSGWYENPRGALILANVLRSGSSAYLEPLVGDYEYMTGGEIAIGSMTDYSRPPGFRSLATGDLNGDGRTDVVALNTRQRFERITGAFYSPSLAVFTGRAGGLLSSAQPYRVNAIAGPIAIGELGAPLPSGHEATGTVAPGCTACHDAHTASEASAVSTSGLELPVREYVGSIESSVVYSGSWTYEPTLRFTHAAAAGDALSLTFSGEAVAWYPAASEVAVAYMREHGGGGVADVILDGVPRQTVDLGRWLANGGAGPAVELSGLDDGPHTLRIAVKGANGYGSGTSTVYSSHVEVTHRGGYRSVAAGGGSAAFCFGCHSLASVGATGSAVAEDFDPANQSYHAVVAPSRRTNFRSNFANGLWSASSRLTCGDCHITGVEPHEAQRLRHGSAYAPSLVSPGAVVSPKDPENLCFDCHSYDYFAGAGGPGTSWSPGNSTEHRLHSGRVIPCLQCHDPHGSARFPFMLRPELQAWTFDLKRDPQTGFQVRESTEDPDRVKGVICYGVCHGPNRQ